MIEVKRKEARCRELRTGLGGYQVASTSCPPGVGH